MKGWWMHECLSREGAKEFRKQYLEFLSLSHKMAAITVVQFPYVWNLGTLSSLIVLEIE